MLRFLFILFCSFTWMANGYCQINPTVDTIFSRADSWHDKVHTMYYVYRASDQLGTLKDTIRTYGNGYFQKIKDDRAVYKYHISNLSNNQTLIFDGKKLAEISHKRKSAIISTPHKNKPYSIHYHLPHVPYVFTKNFFTNLKSDTSVISIKMVADTLIEGSRCYQVRVEYEPYTKFSTRIIHYFFKKDNFFCLGKQGFGTFTGIPRHHDFIIVLADINGDLDKNLFKHFKNIPPKYKKSKSRKKYKYTKPLKKNKKAPKFLALTLDSTEVTNENLLNQITILDFWYVGCSPCLAIAPILDSIEINYQDRGVQVLGMNPFDGIHEVKRFKEFSGLSYKSLVVDSKVADKFNVQGYPTIYIINQDGKIAFSMIGGDKNLYNILSEQVEILLSP